MHNIKPVHFLLLSLLLFVISLTQRTICFDHDCGDLGSGMFNFIMGPIAIFEGGPYLAWLANPLLILSWITYKNFNGLSIVSGVIGLIISLSFLMFSEVSNLETGQIMYITDVALGYWLWVSSIVILVLGNSHRYFQK